MQRTSTNWYQIHHPILVRASSCGNWVAVNNTKDSSMTPGTEENIASKACLLFIFPFPVCCGPTTVFFPKSRDCPTKQEAMSTVVRK